MHFTFKESCTQFSVIHDRILYPFFLVGLDWDSRADQTAERQALFLHQTSIDRNGYYPRPASSLQCKSQIERVGKLCENLGGESGSRLFAELIAF